MTDGGGMEASFLACQFLPVVRQSLTPLFFLLFLFRPPAATLILPSHSASAAAWSLSVRDRLFSLLQSRRGDSRQKKGKVRK